METLWSILGVMWFIFQICAGCMLLALVIHSEIYNQWKWNFSKKGLKYHLKTYITFMIMGLGITFVVSEVKKLFHDRN